ncbi:MAG: PIN domain-containing protein [Gammaproteobacteria bacterium]|nr:PIN domain-containing protein [Gammaproteobacteria bacterium]MBU1262255.1 PIN domain-containing protein [bacterium]MBU1599411.1 PIN domain-containing protein [bacterium]MBU1629441.1 PIN domain-containing protein [Gammaproteobacteria bacterium]MBU1927350.1 PIN domain-containing protein [Gammaproteobacteria bacterium]
MTKYLTLDSNIFIASIKGDEEYSDASTKIISRIGSDLLLVEPSIIFTEVGNAVTRNLDVDVAREELQSLRRAITVIQTCDVEFCYRAGLTGGQYNIYSCDSLYLQTSIDHQTILVSLDEDEFVNRIKAKTKVIEVFHVREFLY